MRKYIRKPDSRRYVTYTSEELDHCLELVENGSLSVVKASKMFDIPRRTLYNRIYVKRSTNGSPKKYGGQPVFSKQEEIELAQHFIAVTEFGFSISKVEMRSFVRDYLLNIGRVVPRFRDNLPGADWCDGFLQRNPTVNAAMAANKGTCSVINNPKVYRVECKPDKSGEPKNRVNLSKVIEDSCDSDEAQQSINNQETEAGLPKRRDRPLKRKNCILKEVLPLGSEIVISDSDEAELAEVSLLKRRCGPPKRYL